ncbi:uncharacterized protein METZ01_LOCUS502333 [marine metagenome]|uniref:Uncharacterized protein n=1 Tax=marine metagenome TaxID=408172 RepID=A0A383DYR7_9ZZZZ
MEKVPSSLSTLVADHSGGGRLSSGLRKKRWKGFILKLLLTLWITGL